MRRNEAACDLNGVALIQKSRNFGARIYRFPRFRRNVRLRTDTMNEASGSTHPRHHVRTVPVMFAPLGDRAGKAVSCWMGTR